MSGYLRWTRYFFIKSNKKDNDERFEGAINDYYLKSINVDKIPTDEDLEKMKISLNWLKRHLELAVSIDEQTTPTGVQRIFADAPTSSVGIDGVDDHRVDVDVAVLDTGIDREHPDLNVVRGRMVDITGFDAYADTAIEAEAIGLVLVGDRDQVLLGQVDPGRVVFTQTAGQGLGDEGLARARGAGKDQVVAAGGRNFKRAARL